MALKHALIIALTGLFIIGCGSDRHSPNASPETPDEVIEPIVEPIVEPEPVIENNCDSISQHLDELKTTNEMLIEQIEYLIEKVDELEKKKIKIKFNHGKKNGKKHGNN